MKKLLQINTAANAAAPGRIAEEIGIHAMSQGWESFIAHGVRYSKPSKSQGIEIGKIFDVYWHVLQTKLFDKHGLASKNATKSLVRTIDQINPDIIHLHNLHGYYINIEILFKYLSEKSIPLVWTLHDCWAFTGHCAYFDMVKCEKWKTECNTCPLKKDYPSSIFADRSKENFNLKKALFNAPKNLTLVPVSNWLKGLLDDSFLKNIPAKVIHNGLDLKTFKAKPTNRVALKYGLDDVFVLLGVANIWNKRKGLRDFIKLSKRLSQNERIILVGLDEKQVKTLPNNIIGIRRTESIEELCEFYSVADVFINPTYEDNFPTTNLEALACGTPVITYNTGGSPEAISRETGYIVEKGDIEGLIKCVREVKRINKHNFSDACRVRSERLFDKNLRYADYLGLYNELLNEKDKKHVLK